MYFTKKCGPKLKFFNAKILERFGRFSTWVETSKFHNCWRHCAISALQISKKHFARFFCKNEVVSTARQINVTMQIWLLLVNIYFLYNKLAKNQYIKKNTDWRRKVPKIFCSIKNDSLRAHFYIKIFFLINSISKTLYFLKACPILNKLSAVELTKYSSLLWIFWFLAKNF